MNRTVEQRIRDKKIRDNNKKYDEVKTNLSKLIMNDRYKTSLERYTQTIEYLYQSIARIDDLLIDDTPRNTPRFNELTTDRVSLEQTLDVVLNAELPEKDPFIITSIVEKIMDYCYDAQSHMDKNKDVHMFTKIHTNLVVLNKALKDTWIKENTINTICNMLMNSYSNMIVEKDKEDVVDKIHEYYTELEFLEIIAMSLPHFIPRPPGWYPEDRQVTYDYALYGILGLTKDEVEILRRTLKENCKPSELRTLLEERQDQRYYEYLERSRFS
jgi:uncharacterized protein YlzI (FlbEa/FlbD family)